MEEGDLVMAVDITDEVITENEAIEDQTEAMEYRCETCLKSLKKLKFNGTHYQSTQDQERHYL